MITPNYFRVASKTARYNAYLTAPFLAALLQLSSMENQGGGLQVQVLILLIQVVDLAMFLYAFSALKLLLTVRFDSPPARRMTDVLMGLNTATLLLNIIPLFDPSLSEVMDWVSIPTLVILGVAYCIAGFRISRLGEQGLYGRGPSFALALMCMGLLLALVFLALAGALVNILVMLSLARILDAAASDLEQSLPSESGG